VACKKINVMSEKKSFPPEEQVDKNGEKQLCKGVKYFPRGSVRDTETTTMF
jgi:hypothetical protein